ALHRERYTVYGACGAGVSIEPGARVLYLEERHQRPARGSRASRSPSPTRLKASTVITIARPGKVATLQAPIRLARPTETMYPQEGEGGWTPSPRKERPASSTIVLPIPRVAATITGASTFGTT